MIVVGAGPDPDERDEPACERGDRAAQAAATEALWSKTQVCQPYRTKLFATCHLHCTIESECAVCGSVNAIRFEQVADAVALILATQQECPPLPIQFEVTSGGVLPSFQGLLLVICVCVLTATHDLSGERERWEPGHTDAGALARSRLCPPVF